MLLELIALLAVVLGLLVLIVLFVRWLCKGLFWWPWDW